MEVNQEGKLIPREKIRGKKKVIREIVERMKEHALDGTDYSGKCFISQSACMEDAREVADLVEQTFPQTGRSRDDQRHRHGHRLPHRAGHRGLFYWGDPRTV